MAHRYSVTHCCGHKSERTMFQSMKDFIAFIPMAGDVSVPESMGEGAL